MKKRTTALATIIAAAGLAGAATVSAHASPAYQAQLTGMHHSSSRVASTRLHALLATPGATSHHTVRLDDWGCTGH